MFEEIKPTFKESAFNQCDWSEFYPEAQEAIPLNMPEPKGNSVNLTVLLMLTMQAIEPLVIPLQVFLFL